MKWKVKHIVSKEPGGGRAARADGVVDTGVLWNGHSWFGHKGGPKLSFFRWEQVQNYLSSDGNRSKSKSWIVIWSNIYGGRWVD